MGYAVSDYFAQGQSFKNDWWAMHVAVPPDGKGLKRASLLVCLTRFAAWEDVHVLGRLWPFNAPESVIEKVVTAYVRATAVDPALGAEIERLQQQADLTAARVKVFADALQQRVTSRQAGGTQ